MQTILLLHGAIGASDQMGPLAAELAKTYEVHTMNFSGHGGVLMPNNEFFSIENFAKDVLDFMLVSELKTISIFGYSMGGYVAMYLARHYPEKIEKVVTLATKFNWDKDIAAKEMQMLDPERIEDKLPAFAQTLVERHAPNDWKVVLNNTADMLFEMGKNNPMKMEDYSTITKECLILLGDRDKMVTIEETIEVYKALPNSKFGILPGTPHPIELVDIDTISYFIRKVLK